MLYKVKTDQIIYRAGNGIKLINPYEPYHGDGYTTGYTVADVMELPFNFYFLNTDGITLQMNQPCVEVCGFQSTDDSIGKSLFDVSNQESATELINNCNLVIAENKIKIFEEKNLRNDGVILGFLSIKSPWYDDYNQTIGIFGCSIVLGKNSLAESLLKIAELGLLSSSGFTLTNRLVADIKSNSENLSERENLCVHYICKGYTQKEIAKMLSVSPKTIETYVERAKQKLHCSNKAELIAAYVRHRIT
jgi:DNA-binding CsgD family transcriptional regulator